jgi:Na+-translocating ferredoxin:NAD+ oxidoreductase RnfG subunit
VPARKLAASLARVYGAAAAADTVLVDGAAVYRVHQGGVLLGYARVLDVKGKDQPITFLVATDSGLVLKDVDILVYREPYGGEVAYEAWRRQFRGKAPDAPLEVGRDIRSISGATISVNAVTAGVRRAVADFAAWRREGKLP